ncbi:hypothetical protein BH20ACT7_BH20ACT7_04030 [soil metagenome]
MAIPRLRMLSSAVLFALVATLLPLPSVAAAPPAAAAPAVLTNLSHIDYLGDAVSPPSQAGHRSYRLGAEPEIGVLWTYAEPQDGGPYRRIGGGEYDPETDTYSQGAFNADDISRAAVVYLRHWRQFGDDHSRDRAYQMLRGLTYLQTTKGPNRGNVVLWMQPDGTLNPSAEPIELPDPSDSGPSYWLARTIWALGEGYAAFRDVDPAFAAFLRNRLKLSIGAVDRQVLADKYGTYLTVDGLRWPAWLITDGADASSEAVYGLSAYAEAGGGPRAQRVLRQLADGIAAMPLGSAQRWPFGAVMPWAQSRSVWHAWGDQMAGSLATAAAVTGNRAWLQTAIGEVGRFTPHLLVQAGPQQGWLPAPADTTQIAYGADATLQNLLRVADATRRSSFRRVAGVAAAWYFGNNPSGEPMYDPATGRTFDGVAADGTVNLNSGAESTIHGLLSMLALDRHPRVARRARIAAVGERVTWQLVEAEAGRLSGDALARTPADPWTGESLWSGGGYVALRPGGRVRADVDLPTHGRYALMPVFHRLFGPRGNTATRYRLGGHRAGRQSHGDDGTKGVTPWPGYLDVGRTDVRGRLAAGMQELSVGYIGDGPAAQLDAVLVQPEIEWLLLSGGDRHQGVLRSFARSWARQRVSLPGAERVVARSYDQRGRLVDVARSWDGSVRVRLAPGGFAYVRG